MSPSTSVGAEIGEGLRLLWGADEGGDLVAALAQLAHDMTADEPGSSGDEDLHARKPILNIRGLKDDGYGDEEGGRSQRSSWRSL